MKRYAIIFAGVLLFGVLMGIKDEFSTTAARVLIGGCAGAVLGTMLIFAMRRPAR